MRYPMAWRRVVLSHRVFFGGADRPLLFDLAPSAPFPKRPELRDEDVPCNALSPLHVALRATFLMAESRRDFAYFAHPGEFLHGSHARETMTHADRRRARLGNPVVLATKQRALDPPH